MKRIVSNTGPLLHLYEAQSMDLLSLIGELHTPKQVVAELENLVADWKTPEWCSIDALSIQHKEQATAWVQAGIVDQGEAAALALALQIGAEWFLTDDAAARVLAQTLKIETHGSLGVVLWASSIGYLNQIEAETALEHLFQSSLWVSSRIRQRARNALKQIFQV